MQNKNITKLLAVLPMAALITGCGRASINANDYLEVNIDGYDTVAQASYSIDYEKMIEDNAEAFGIDEKSGSEMLGLEMLMEEHLDGKLDKTSELKNGDEVVFKWDDNAAASIEEKYKVKIKLSEEKITVKDLEEAQKFDPFEFVNVVFDGISPNGSVKIDEKSEIPVKGISFTVDKTDKLSNGDKIKITFGSDSCTDDCFIQGYVPEATEKEYTVEGLASYIQKIDEVPKDAFDKMDAHAQDVMKAHVAESWSDSEGLKEMKLIGNYMLTPKDSSLSTNVNNSLYFIYKMTAKDVLKPDDPNATFDYYYYSVFSNIVILADGTCSFDLSGMKHAEGSSAFGIKSGEVVTRDRYYYWGYEDLDSMFNKLITANIDKYSYESTVEK